MDSARLYVRTTPSFRHSRARHGHPRVAPQGGGILRSDCVSRWQRRTIASRSRQGSRSARAAAFAFTAASANAKISFARSPLGNSSPTPRAQGSIGCSQQSEREPSWPAYIPNASKSHNHFAGTLAVAGVQVLSRDRSQPGSPFPQPDAGPSLLSRMKLTLATSRAARMASTLLTAGKNVAGFAPIGGAVDSASLVDPSDPGPERAWRFRAAAPKELT